MGWHSWACSVASRKHFLKQHKVPGNQCGLKILYLAPCSLIPPLQLGLPLKLRNLPSGLPVVQSATHSDEEVCQVIAELVEPPIDYALGPPVTASDVAK